MDKLLKSNSKGKWVWNNLRRKKVKYEKVGNLPLKRDWKVEDEELFEGLRTEERRGGSEGRDG